MMTLRELKEKVEVVANRKDVPKASALEKSGISIVARELINAETTITVYQHGFVIYRTRKKATVFPLHSCEGYSYDSVAAPAQVL